MLKRRLHESPPSLHPLSRPTSTRLSWAAALFPMLLAACGDSSESSCPDGLTLCGGECVNLLTDNRFCSADGSCGTACASGQLCNGSGLCVLVCPSGHTICNGRCVDTDLDPDNCGGCADSPAPGDHVCA
ncbi:hypothetical protein JXA88_19155, partial [Candidatus Fermentibacteria bacterium]|nr:hypothetical protein [Candidatus Fermentibacteria bacterium]